jgi:hypothetical protein
MKTISVPGPVSGRNYSITIGGEEPTVDDRQFIDAYVREQEASFAQQYQERFGQDLLPSRGFGGQVSEFFRGIPAGAGSLLETSALGLVTPFGEETEGRLREGIRGIGMNLQDRYAPQIGREDTVGGRLGQAVGSMGAIAGAGLAGTAVGGPWTGLGVAGTLGAAAGAGEASERARAADATLEERNLATQLGLIPGALEIVPLVRLNRVLERGGLRERLTRALITGGEEGVQEAASSIAQNLIEQGVYNPEQGTFEGTGEDLGYGAGAGALVQAISDLVIPGRLRSRVTPPTPPPTPPATPRLLLAPPATPPAAPPTPDTTVSGGVRVDPDIADARAYFDSTLATLRDGAPLTDVQAETQAAQMTLERLQAAGQIDLPKLRPLVRSLRMRAVTEPDMGPPTPPMETYAGDLGVDLRQQEMAAAPEPTTQETQDAEIAPTGPVGDDVVGGGDGTAGGIGGLGLGPVAGEPDTTGAEAPVPGPVGEPVLGAPEPSVAAGPQPDALTVEPEAAMPASIPVGPGAIRPSPLSGTLYSEMGIDSLEKLLRDVITPNTARGFVGQRWLSDNLDLARGQGANKGAIVELDGAFVSGRESRSKPAISAGLTDGTEFQSDYINENAIRSFTLGPDKKLKGQLRRLVEEKFDVAVADDGSRTYTVRGATATPAAPTPAPTETTPDPEAVVARQMALDEADKAALAAKLGTDRSGVVDLMLDDPARVDGAMDDIAREKQSATPAPLKRPASAAPITTTLQPGMTVSDTGQVIPAPGTPAPRFTPEGVAIDPLMAEAIAAQEVQDRAAAQDAIDAWYEQNASPEVKAARARIEIDMAGPAVMPAADMEVVLDLLRRAPKPRAKGKISPEQAAFVYFSKSPDTNFALESIAYDQAQKLSPEYDAQGRRVSREADFRRETEFESADEAAFYAGTGAEVAMRAARWVRDNLSEATRAQVADYTFNKYRPIDYGATAESRDVQRAQNRNRKAEVDKIIRETYGDGTLDVDTAAELGFATEDLKGYDLSSFAGVMQWPNRAHPRVEAQLRVGDVRGALQGLALTAPNPTHRKLAQKLLARIGDTRSQVVSPEVMDRIRATISPETPTLGVETPGGVYVHPLNETQLDAMRREGHNEAADLIEQYGGQILFNETTNISPELALHEATHAVADGVLANKSHPLTRQLDKLRVELLKFMPATTYGLTNVRELLTEGMTNPVFRRDLSYANVEGQPFSAFQRFRDIVGNWLRGVIGLQPKKRDTAADAVDRALDAVLAINPNEMNAGDMLNASFAPGGVERMVKSMQDRVVPMNSWARGRIERFMEDPAVPNRVKSAFAYFGQGVQFTAENAQKLLPSSTQILDLLRQHKGASDQMSNLIRRSLEPFANTMAKYDGRSDITNAVARVALRGSAEGVDVINQPLSHYQGYSFRYNVMDQDGNVVRSVESKRYNTERERNQALADYNAKLPADAPRAARARRGYDSTPEDVALYRALEQDKQLLQRDAPDVIGELKRMQAVPESLRERLADALRARIEAMAPNNREQQNKIFNRFYSKITAESLIDYYFALSRQGNHWVTYTGYDADTGQVATFKHSFPSLNEQQRALQMLQKQNERYYARAQQLMGDQRPVNEFQAAVERGGESIPTAVADQLIQENVLPATEVFSYVQNPSDPRVRPPTEMMGRIFETLEGMSDTATITDPETGRTVDIRDQIVDLFLDSMPESSFLNTFRKRAGTRGFENDITYLQDTVTAGDLSKNFMQNNMRLANQIVSMEYGAKFSGYRNKIREELGTLENRLPATDNLYQRARKKDAAQGYYDALVEHSMAPFRVTGNLASSAVGATYAATLGFNPSTAILTTMSLPIFYAPYAGGKYGYGKLIGAMGKASRIISGSGREKQAMRIGRDGQLEPVTEQRPFWDITIDNIDYSQPQFAWMRDAHKFWADRGMFLNSPIMSELLGENPNLIQKITSKSAIFQHLAERAVRENALVSTYIMELQNQMGDTRSDVNAFIADLESGVLQPTAEQANTAASEAITMSEKTNGPMLAAMGPRASIGDFGRVVYLFKRHPLAMMNNMFQTVSRSFAPDSPDRAIARRQLTGMLGMLGLTSGIMGLPMMQQVAMLFDYFLIEDDEPDFVSQLRMTTGELGTYGALDYLLGTRTSERIGLGGAIYREGFQSSGMPPLFQLAEGFGGPVMGLALKYTSPQTREHLAEERYGRFMEQVLPSSMANFFRAYRYLSEGVQNLRGDIVVDDIGPFHIAAQALGFMPASYAQRLAINSLGTRINNAIESEVQRLMRKRNKAIFEGDMETVREVMQEINEFRRRHPGRIDNDTLRSSLRAFNDRTQKTNYGLMVAPRNKAYIDSILNEIGSSSLWK